MIETTPIPVMPVGRYRGTPVDQIPNSYLRWVITQGFSDEVTECAKKKLEQSDYNDLFLNVTRHAVDMFSKRFLTKWNLHCVDKGDDALGLASFIAVLAQEAWENGKDVSKHRHKDDGIVREFDGIQFVFIVSPRFPDYKELVTIM